MSDEAYKKSIADWKRTYAAGGWIAVDLDGTLAVHDGWYGPYHVGKPVPKMVERVKKWLKDGIEVRIMTARAQQPRDRAVIFAIEQWCMEHIGQVLAVTNEKDYQMIAIYDDRAVQIIPNTGERADGQEDECCFNGLCPQCTDEEE